MRCFWWRYSAGWNSGANLIEALFPDGAIALVASEAMWEGSLFPEEAACIERAAAKRRREFTAGRLCAREALARLGVPPAPLLPNSDRTPRWPEGVVGSISHCGGYCGAVVARCQHFAGLGLDAEVAAPLDPKLVSRICRPSELARMADCAPPPGTSWEKLVFSAKESTYKCYYPLTRTFLGFHDVEIAFSPAESSFTATVVRDAVPAAAGTRNFSGRFACDGARVFTGVALAAPAGTQNSV